MVHGYAPFYDDNHFALYHKILTSPLQWRITTSNGEMTDVHDFVAGLVTRDTTKRLGCMKRGSDDVKNHK